MSRRIERYAKARKNRIEGKFNGAPLFHSFPRLSTEVPAILKGAQVMTLAGNGVGKSQSVIGISIMPIYRLIKKHGYKAKIHVFLLEDPLELFEDRLFCHVMRVQYNIEIDPLKLNSIKEDLISEDVLSKFNAVDRRVEDILKYCVVVDNVFNPTGIYKYMRNYSEKIGKHVYEERILSITDENGVKSESKENVYVKFEHNDPDEHQICIIDNINNLEEEYDSKLKKTLTKHEVMSKWCKDYARKQLCKNWGFTVWNIMQTDLESDKKQFDYKGNVIIEKIMPTLASLGENKTVSRAHHLVLSIFSPSRFGLTDYGGYDTGRLGNNIRIVTILKSNFGSQDVEVPMYFDGRCSYYKELPKIDKMNEKEYLKYESN